ncbi:uncharacterized protein AMSG_00583 [Thecamonas trahens ATCC 50062]|uniref:Uncharacterized protein n=1 Tax=Thecamonas trahens ATCC 50062 TaxID=461836 RepID=A0A0L0DBW7_THETB|nr:hypothetical protein AMSG_00583 [Thecamonas trahens ATCC 50062]KNC48803.1 hypothetical protein AMSG_00583 [Thecamonas trahens ATCC 50062]|eukprot:XP_013762854.1 hypothetical protein AMSG_00583 [Thecamonas trahens ATCC 50062]
MWRLLGLGSSHLEEGESGESLYTARVLVVGDVGVGKHALMSLLRGIEPTAGDLLVPIETGGESGATSSAIRLDPPPRSALPPLELELTVAAGSEAYNQTAMDALVARASPDLVLLCFSLYEQSTLVVAGDFWSTALANALVAVQPDALPRLVLMGLDLIPEATRSELLPIRHAALERARADWYALRANERQQREDALAALDAIVPEDDSGGFETDSDSDSDAGLPDRPGLSIVSVESSAALSITPEDHVEHPVDADLLVSAACMLSIPDVCLVTDNTALLAAARAAARSVAGLSLRTSCIRAELADLVAHAPRGPVAAAATNAAARVDAFLGTLPVRKLAASAPPQIRNALLAAAFTQERVHRCAGCPPLPPPPRSSPGAVLCAADETAHAAYNEPAVAALLLPLVAAMRGVGPDEAPSSECWAFYTRVRAALLSALVAATSALMSARSACPTSCPRALLLTHKLRLAIAPQVEKRSFAAPATWTGWSWLSRM